MRKRERLGLAAVLTALFAVAAPAAALAESGDVGQPEQTTSVQPANNQAEDNATETADVEPAGFAPQAPDVEPAGFAPQAPDVEPAPPFDPAPPAPAAPAPVSNEELFGLGPTVIPAELPLELELFGLSTTISLEALEDLGITID